MIHNFISAILFTLQPSTLMWCLAGVSFGIVIGILPGLNASVGVAMLLPLTFGLPPAKGLAMLVAIYCAAVYSGSIPAILFRIPGTSAACATILDGHELAKKGRGGAAIGMAAIASSLGGEIGILISVFATVYLMKIALLFSPPEYFALGVFGLTIIALLAEGSIVKAIISGGAGLFLSVVGIDQFLGIQRYTFGRIELFSGFTMISLFIGFFAGSQILKKLTMDMRKLQNHKVHSLFPTFREIKECTSTFIRSSILGTFIGILPGAGATIAAFLGYAQAKSLSKHPERFGTGIMEGVAAPESANNAATAGAMVPMLTLGIPGSGTTAVMLGALMIYGIIPGPLLLEKEPELVYGLFASMFVANILFLIIGLALGRWLAYILKIPIYILDGSIFLLCVIGSYAVNNNMFDVWLMVIFSVSGYLMENNGYPVTPLVLGWILGPIIEQNLRRSMIMFYGNLWLLFTRPISAALLILTISVLLVPFLKPIIVNLFMRNHKL